MRGIGRLGGPAGVAPGGKAARPGRAGFSLGTAPEQAASASASGGVVALGLGLLAVQTAQGDAERDAAARRRAETLLEDLAALQAEMLGGAADPARLQRLASLAQRGDSGADPALREVVAHIVLRAQVELARRGGD